MASRPLQCAAATLLSILLALALPPGARAQNAEKRDSVRSILSGVYSEAQAERGRVSFDQTCVSCHTAGQFVENGFLASWAKRTLHNLFEHIRQSMPDDNPGSYPREVYLDVITYILKLNDIPTGPCELKPDSSLMRIRIELKPRS